MPARQQTLRETLDSIQASLHERATAVRTVGLCHSVQGTAEDLADWLGVPADQVNYICAGINHVAFYLRFERDGESLYPLIRKVVEEDRIPDWNRVRYEMLTRLGYFVTESSEHFAEYCPYFIRSEEQLWWPVVRGLKR